jgi:hypothetical protein
MVVMSADAVPCPDVTEIVAAPERFANTCPLALTKAIALSEVDQFKGRGGRIAPTESNRVTRTVRDSPASIAKGAWRTMEATGRGMIHTVAVSATPCTPAKIVAV